jgi:hypothetical protein
LTVDRIDLLWLIRRFGAYTRCRGSRNGASFGAVEVCWSGGNLVELLPPAPSSPCLFCLGRNEAKETGQRGGGAKRIRAFDHGLCMAEGHCVQSQDRSNAKGMAAFHHSQQGVGTGQNYIPPPPLFPWSWVTGDPSSSRCDRGLYLTGEVPPPPFRESSKLMLALRARGGSVLFERCFAAGV